MTTLTAPLAALSLDTTATPALLTDLDATLAAVTAAPDAPTTCTFAPAPSWRRAAPALVSARNAFYGKPGSRSDGSNLVRRSKTISNGRHGFKRL